MRLTDDDRAAITAWITMLKVAQQDYATGRITDVTLALSKAILTGRGMVIRGRENFFGELDAWLDTCVELVFTQAVA